MTKKASLTPLKQTSPIPVCPSVRPSRKRKEKKRKEKKRKRERERERDLYTVGVYVSWGKRKRFTDETVNSTAGVVRKCVRACVRKKGRKEERNEVIRIVTR